MNDGTRTLPQTPSPVLLRSVLPPGFVRHVAELPGKYRNSRAVQPQSGEVGRRETQEKTELSLASCGVKKRVDFSSRVMHDLHVAKLAEQRHELAQYEIVTVFRFTEIMQHGFGIHCRVYEDLHRSPLPAGSAAAARNRSSCTATAGVSENSRIRCQAFSDMRRYVPGSFLAMR